MSLLTAILANRLLETAPDHQGWSLVESPNSVGVFSELLDWASSMTVQRFQQESRIDSYRLGVVLLWLESEVTRRHGGENALWPILSDPELVPWNERVRSILFVDYHPTPLHRELLRKAAIHYSLRHTFEVEEAHNWFRLVYLQFGFTREDAVQRLAPWLSGQIVPISVQKLLQASDSGATAFQRIWRSLRMFRLGNLSETALNSQLRTSPWVLPEWSADLISAARRSSTPVLDVADIDASELRFFTPPQIAVTQAGTFSFTTQLCNLAELGLHAPDYRLMVGNQVLASIIRQPDGSYYNDAGDGVQLPSLPAVSLSLVDFDGEVVAHDEAVLWDSQEEVTVYSARRGTVLQKEERLRTGAEVFLITASDVTIHPAAFNFLDISFGYRLHHVAAGWTGDLRALLDEDLVWTAKLQTPTVAAAKLAVAARFTETLDLSQGNWNQMSPPWSLPIEFYIPNPWTVMQMRWHRADGRIEIFNEIPTHLQLTELDALKPVVLRLRLISGAVTRTEHVRVPVPLVAAIKWTSNGLAIHHDPSRKLLLTNAREQTWSFHLPVGETGPRDPRLCSFVEGRVLHGRLKSRPCTLPDFGGYGAALRILEDPYLNGNPVLEISPCVLDGGVVGAVVPKPEENLFHIKSKFTDLGIEHSLLAWWSTVEGGHTLQPIPREELSVDPEGWVWHCKVNFTLHAVALEFRSTRLGSWFNPHSWSDPEVLVALGEPAHVAAMLRAWKAPILQDEGNHLQNVAAWLTANWHKILPVWLAPGEQLQSGPNGKLWPMPAMNVHWQAALNELLTASLLSPDPQTAAGIVAGLAPGATGVNALGGAVWRLVEICPILAARVSRVYARGGLLIPKDRQLFFNHILAANDLAVTEEREQEIGRMHGNRDGFWLRTTVPRLDSLDNPHAKIPWAYRLLSKSQSYRFYALGRWLREIR
jgi:hypothetical protein